MSVPDISVVIPTYQREQVLINTIHAMLNQTYKNLELVVIDQSQTHSSETAQALGEITDKRFRYYLTDPPSLPAARNFALTHVKAPIVLFLDDDIVPNKDLVKYHLAALNENPDVSAVGGRVLQEGFPIKKGVLRFDNFAVSQGVFTATETGFTNAFAGGNHSLRVQDALAVGGFDTRYYLNAFREESDMSMKMVRAGMKIYYEPRAEILHLAAPYGGTRAKIYAHIYDSPVFYRNEIFFTLRAAKYRWQALKKKYNEYCLVPSRRVALRRRIYFYLGVITAVWRLAFGRQIIAKERT